MRKLYANDNEINTFSFFIKNLNLPADVNYVTIIFLSYIYKTAIKQQITI